MVDNMSSSASIEDADHAVYGWVNDEMNVSVETNNGFRKVPVRWVAGEKSFQAKNNPDFRDNSGALILPLITIERTGVVKDVAKRGGLNSIRFDSKDGPSVLMTTRKIKQDKTANFSNAYAKQKSGKLNFKTSKPTKVVYEETFVPYPVYVEAVYKISFRSEYQQQMNDMLQHFAVGPKGLNYTAIRYNGVLYETFLGQDFSMSNTISEMESERKFETSMEIRVLAPLIGEGRNQELPRVKKRETVVEVKIARERSILNPEEIPER